MTWFELDELVEFGKNKEAKIKTTNSDSDSDSNVIAYYVQPSAVSTFATKRPKANSPLQDRNYTSDNLSAFTQATQGTMETRIKEIETKIEDFTTNITMLLEKSETKRRIQEDLQLRKNQEKMNQIQEALNQMIKISIQKKYIR